MLNGDYSERRKHLRYEDNNEKNRRYPLYHHAVKLLARELCGKTDLVRDNLCADNVADEYAGQDSDYREF